MTYKPLDPIMQAIFTQATKAFSDALVLLPEHADYGPYYSTALVGLRELYIHVPPTRGGRAPRNFSIRIKELV